MLTGFMWSAPVKERQKAGRHGSGMATAACTASAGFLCTDKHATKQFSDHRFPQYDVPLC
jgi:hypothetical protein